jgi:uncharacterized SAM-binding protein YcdF (DUF218 family)
VKLCRFLANVFIVGLVLVLLFLLAFSNTGKFLSAPAKSPEKADAIVILGGGWVERESKGIQLYKQRYAPYVILTGVKDEGKRSAQYSHDRRTRVMLDNGVKASEIFFVYAAENTNEEAKEAVAVLKEHGWGHVIVVSDPPHMRRVQWSWNRAMDGSGMRYTLVESSPAWWNAGKWWENDRSKRFVASEIEKLCYYFVAYP